MKILLLDNYDSFTYNLAHLLTSLGVSALTVRRNDRISVEEAGTFDKILLSPGPGVPSEAGIMSDLIKAYPQKSILGVCLGHQCIAEVHGARLLNMPHPVHGKATTIRVTDGSEKLFQGLPREFKGGRYHSWVVERQTLPESIRVTAEDENAAVMALSHTGCRMKGVQFHPESVLTEYGGKIIKNWLEE